MTKKHHTPLVDALRTEIEAAHRKIAELERIVRRMMRGESPQQPRAASETSPKRTSARKANAKPASGQTRSTRYLRSATKMISCACWPA